ncbi:MAG: MlaE family lipid ABC transporter permease subunit [Bacteroidales bacterium]|nr:MlaE family lipid ABC transporter permease subunit [Bacteroidales bacterium]
MAGKEKKAKSYHFEDNILELRGKFTISELNESLYEIEKSINEFRHDSLVIDLDQITYVDSAGVTAIYYLRDRLIEQGMNVEIKGGSEDIKRKLELFSQKGIHGEEQVSKTGFFERMGTGLAYVYDEIIASFFQLAADITYWSVTDLFKRQTRRKGEFANQAVLIGVNAVLIVGAMSFIIGLVLALQSAAQLRSFGANIYIVDLTVIAMMSEMGPLITAIMVAGRSGSSIAAEIATMKVTNETDALRTMGLNPIRFIIVPKMHGALVTLPFLTIIADVLGIAGGMVIAVTSLDISPMVFIHRMQEAFLSRDILFGVIKSLVFAYLIVITGSYFGFRVKQGADVVGKVTTQAVVVSISLVIIADSIMGLIFY